MTDVFSVANWFLEHNRFLREVVDQDTDEITNLKLQKLLYYAQGAYLAYHDEKLFEDDIEAWAHGPVVNSVYQKYKKYGSQGITEVEPYEIEDDAKEILEAVYDTFGVYSAWGLRNLTHEEDPWKETPQNGTISPKSIKKYFVENYAVQP